MGFFYLQTLLKHIAVELLKLNINYKFKKLKFIKGCWTKNIITERKVIFCTYFFISNADSTWRKHILLQFFYKNPTVSWKRSFQNTKFWILFKYCLKKSTILVSWNLMDEWCFKVQSNFPLYLFSVSDGSFDLIIVSTLHFFECHHFFINVISFCIWVFI